MRRLETMKWADDDDGIVKSCSLLEYCRAISTTLHPSSKVEGSSVQRCDTCTCNLLNSLNEDSRPYSVIPSFGIRPSFPEDFDIFCPKKLKVQYLSSHHPPRKPHLTVHSLFTIITQKHISHRPAATLKKERRTR